MRKKKLISFLATLLVLLIFLITLVQPAAANPYSLLGKGNCAYFAWEMMYRFWPESFNVQREWDAAEWVCLDGKITGNYQAQITDDLKNLRYGDFLIWPRSSRWPHGHVSYVLFADGRGGIAVVAESSNYANAGDYPLLLRDCRYRIKVYEYSRLELGKVKILKCIKREELLCLQTFPKTVGAQSISSGWPIWGLLMGFQMEPLSQSRG